MKDDEHYRKLERMYAGAPTNEYHRPTMKISRGKAEVLIPVEPKYFHAWRARYIWIKNWP